MATGDLTTLANVKQYLGVTATTDDALLTRLISAASSWIQVFTNRSFAVASFTDVLDGNGTERAMLQNYPIATLTSVTAREDNGVAIDPLSLVFDARTVTIVQPQNFTPGMTYRTRFPLGKSNLTVVYTAGYATTPMDIEECCIEMVALRYREKDRVGTSSVNVKGESVTFSVMDVPAQVKTILRNWRDVVPV